MKTLYESLLDDFDTLNKKTHDGILKDIDETYLKNTWFKVGKDGKTIIIEPTRQDYISDDRDVTPYVEWYTRNRERSLSSPDVCKKLHFKFQPLDAIFDDVGGADDEWFKYFDCEYVVRFRLSLEHMVKSIDFSKIKFPITGSIEITNPISVELNEIIPYKDKLEIFETYIIPSTPLKGWKCTHMIIHNATDFIDVGDPGQRINELLENNPDAENIYFTWTGSRDYMKIVTKGTGSQRKFVKFSKVPKTKQRLLTTFDNPTINRMQREVEGWKWQHMGLFECDGAAPGNTLGMGNPMAPTDTTPGTEPVIPTHPRGKKRTRKDIKERQ